MELNEIGVHAPDARERVRSVLRPGLLEKACEPGPIDERAEWLASCRSYHGFSAQKRFSRRGVLTWNCTAR